MLKLIDSQFIKPVLWGTNKTYLMKCTIEKVTLATDFNHRHQMRIEK